jgi:hypothetical protein
VVDSAGAVVPEVPPPVDVVGSDVCTPPPPDVLALQPAASAKARANATTLVARMGLPC